MKKTLLKAFAFLAISCFVNTNLNAQNVGINATGAAPDGGAMLDIAATNKGLLIPRVNITNLATIAPIVGSATTSMLVYNTNATTGQGFYYWDGAQWVQFFAGNIPADNGLYFNAGAGRVRLGGPLVENTTITQAGFNMTYNLNGTGDFRIQDNGVNRFLVLDNGRTAVGGANTAGQFNVTGNSYFSNDIFLRDGAVNAGDILVRIYDSADDGIIDVYENNAMNHRIHAKGTTIFNNQQIAAADFRIETSGQANMFFVDAGTNEIGIRTAAPGNMLEMTNGGQAVGANSMANFENQGASGVALGARNTSTTSGYNAAEFITDYANTAFLSAGVMGLAIYQGGVNAPTIGVRAATNEWQGTGIYASRFNSGGANTGWGGLVYNDLGYTGFFGAISDERTKKDIKKIKGALSIIDQLNPVMYHFDLEKYPTMGLNEELEYGFIAQEVRQVLPEITRIKGFDPNACVEMKENGQIENKREMFVAMDYTRIIPILTKGIQEQQEVIDQQNQKIEALEKIVLELQKKMNQ